MSAENLKLIKPGEVRVRFAPSPTGPFHIGNLRTALFNHFFTKKHQGTFILRIEDTDKERSKKEWEEGIIESLRWLGIEWQEGPIYQSKRTEIYQKYLEKLLAQEKIYHCFCSPEELEAQRQYLMSIGKPPRYDGKCRDLPKSEVEERLKKGDPYVFRLKTPHKKVIFNDLLRGKIENDTENFGDMVVAKAIDQPLYNLACVIDDFELKITHIIRGEDHISNTPKQIVLAEALDIETPQYIHLPMILGADRSKLSKRHGATFVPDYKKQGYLPEAMVNFLALLGWNPGTEKEIFSMASLIKEFSIDHIQKSAAVFNIDKLNWINGFYIRQKSIDKLTALCAPYLLEAGLISSEWLKEKLIVLKKIVALYQERLKKLSEIGELVEFFFKAPDYDRGLLVWKKMTDKELENSLDKSKKVLSKIKEKEWRKEKIEKELMEAAGENRGELLWPLRVALSGQKASAPPFDIAALLGKEKTLDRLKLARKKI